MVSQARGTQYICVTLGLTASLVSSFEQKMTEVQNGSALVDLNINILFFKITNNTNTCAICNLHDFLFLQYLSILNHAY